MAVTREEVRHVARLARLALTEEEEARFAGQLSAILDAFVQLRELDTSGIEPTAHATRAGLAFREDSPEPSLPPEDVLRNAPATSGTSFRVPKIIE